MENYQSFKNEWNGRRVDYDHVDGYQCVDLILEFMNRCGGVSGGISGNAIDYATKPSPAFVNATERITDGSKQAGDIVVMAGLPGKPYGHIALRDENLDEMLEQNGATGSGTGTGKDAIGVYREIPYSRVVAVYRLRVWITAPAPAAPTPAPTPPPAPAAPSHPYSVENIAPRQMQAQANPTHEWDLDYTTWAGIGNHPENALTPGTQVTVVAIAHHNLGSKYYMPDAGQPNGYNVVDLTDYVAPALTPAPIAPPVVNPPLPTPAPAPEAPQIIYEKLTQPVTYTTNKQPTDVWDFDFSKWLDIEAHVVRQLNLGTSLVIVGRAKHQLGGVYMMTADDFGNADTTGTPTAYSGINIVDLDGVAEAPVPVVPAPVISAAEAVPVVAPGSVVAPEAVAAPAPDNSVTVKQTSKPSELVNPFLNLTLREVQMAKDSLRETVKPLVTSKDVIVHDLENLQPAVKIAAGRLLPVAGEFYVDAEKFLLTIPSAAKKHWYAFPAYAAQNVTASQRKKAEQILEDIWDKYHTDMEDELDRIFSEGMKFEEDITSTGNAMGIDTKKLHGYDRAVDVAARLLFGKNKNKTK
jgi:hypothetical protein